VAIPSSLPLSRAHDEFFLRYRWPWFPVVDSSGHYVGLIRQEGVTTDPADSRRVADAIDATTADWQVGQDVTLESVLGSEPLQSLGALMAVDADGVLRGVVTIDQVRRALQSAAARPA
jgi:hypothetical protein